MDCPLLSCPGLFRCIKEALCVHQYYVCDGITHCSVSRDDEKLCDKTLVPSNCNCYGYGCICFPDRNVNVLTFPKYLRSLVISHFSYLFKDESNFNFNYPFLLVLDLSFSLNNTFDSVATFKCPELRKLDLSGNFIDTINPFLFYNFRKLEHLSLSNNRLVELINSPLAHLKDLGYLYLTDNKIKVMEHRLNFPKLSVLDLEKNKLFTLEWTSFQNLLSLKHVNLKDNPIVHVDDKVITLFQNFNILEINHKGFYCFPMLRKFMNVAHTRKTRERFCDPILIARPLAYCAFTFSILLLLFWIYNCILYVYCNWKEQKAQSLAHVLIIDLGRIFHIFLLFGVHP